MVLRVPRGMPRVPPVAVLVVVLRVPRRLSWVVANRQLVALRVLWVMWMIRMVVMMMSITIRILRAKGKQQQSAATWV